MDKRILLLLLFVPTILFAQKTKKVVDKVTNETFYVLKSDKKTRHGEYQKFGFNNKLLIQGYYKAGVKDSIWECFDLDGQLILKYSYIKNELIFYKPKVENKKYKTMVNGTSLDTTLSRPPIYLNGDGFFQNEVIRNVQYPTIAQENGESGKVIVSFIIDKFGKTGNYHVKTPIGYGMDEEVIRALKLIPDDWLPGVLNGQPVDVEVDFPFTFRLN